MPVSEWQTVCVFLSGEQYACLWRAVFLSLSGRPYTSVSVRQSDDIISVPRALFYTGYNLVTNKATMLGKSRVYIGTKVQRNKNNLLIAGVHFAASTYLIYAEGLRN